MQIRVGLVMSVLTRRESTDRQTDTWGTGHVRTEARPGPGSLTGGDRGTMLSEPQREPALWAA